MNRLLEKISYLKGLAEGMNVAEIGPQGRMINEILDVMTDMVNVTSHVKQEFEDFKIYVESIDEDLYDLEEDIYGDEDGEYTQVKCRHCGSEVYFETDLLDDEDRVEIICPNCSEVVCVNDASLDLEPAIIRESFEDEGVFHSISN